MEEKLKLEMLKKHFNKKSFNNVTIRGNRFYMLPQVKKGNRMFPLKGTGDGLKFYDAVVLGSTIKGGKIPKVRLAFHISLSDFVVDNFEGTGIELISYKEEGERVQNYLVMGIKKMELDEQVIYDYSQNGGLAMMLDVYRGLALNVGMKFSHGSGFVYDVCFGWKPMGYLDISDVL